MKHNTINLVKFKALSKRLGLPLCWTVGALETLWLFALHNSRDGDLSKFSALEIAGWMEFPGDESDLIEALVETGWMDRDGGALTVHDWHEHKPNWLKAAAASPLTKSKSDEKPSKSLSDTLSDTHNGALSDTQSATLSDTPRARVARTKPNQTKPSPTKPSPTTPNQTKPDPAVAVGGCGGGGVNGKHGEDWLAARTLANQNHRRVGKMGSLRDRRRFIQIAYIAANELGEEFLLDPLRILETTRDVEKPFAFWWKITQEVAAERGFDLGARLTSLRVPELLEQKPDWMK